MLLVLAYIAGRLFPDIPVSVISAFNEDIAGSGIVQEDGSFNVLALFTNNLRAMVLGVLYGFIPFLYLPALALGVNAAILGMLASLIDGQWLLLAAGILLFTGFLCLSGERLQLGLVLSAVYIIASGERERRQSEGATLRAMLLKPDMPETPAPVRWIAISETATVLDAVREMRPGHTHLFAVMNASGGVQTVLTQALIMAAVERDSTSPLSSLIA